MKQPAITLFSWGYWGWGNATRQLVQAVDAVEADRGFKPPLFIDVRISRSVRAIGFSGNAFGDLVGEQRYKHMPALGNLFIKHRTGKRIQIQDPAAADDLLEHALRAREVGQRVIFFCSCEFPGPGNHCHRVTVANLVLKYARQRDLAVQIVEWPGGKPQAVELAMNDQETKRLLRGGKSIPLGAKVPKPELAGLPWGSVVQVKSPQMELAVIAGPAHYSSGKWFLPVPDNTADPTAPVEKVVGEARKWRKEMGLDIRVG